MLRAVHLVVPDWRVAALLVSFVAGAVAVLYLSRLAEQEGRPGAGPYAVAAVLLSPFGCFLFAGYTETLFLAFALPAWIFARQGRWQAAAFCALGAASVRISGIFLIAALVVEFVTGAHGLRTPEGWRRGAWLAVPLMAPLAYAAYQWRRTGDWLAWHHAESQWGRHMTPPWDVLKSTWALARPAEYYSDAMRMEIIAVFLGLGLTAVLLHRRRWAEAVLVFLPVAALSTSAPYWASAGRGTLLWFPLWVFLGSLAVRHPRAFAGYALVSGPLMVKFTVIYAASGWAG